MYDSSSSKISVETNPGRFPHKVCFIPNLWCCRDVSHQCWNFGQNLVRFHYSVVRGDMDHWKENPHLVDIFKRREQLMIPHTESRWRVCTRRDIHLCCHVNGVFMWYIWCRLSPVPPWRRGLYGSSSRLCRLSWDHLMYFSSFTGARCTRVFSRFQKFLVWSRMCRSLPYFSIVYSSTEICIGVFFSGRFNMFVTVSLSSDAPYFWLIPLLMMAVSNGACCLKMCLNCM